MCNSLIPHCRNQYQSGITRYMKVSLMSIFLFVVYQFYETSWCWLPCFQWLVGTPVLNRFDSVNVSYALVEVYVQMKNRRFSCDMRSVYTNWGNRTLFYLPLYPQFLGSWVIMATEGIKLITWLNYKSSWETFCNWIMNVNLWYLNTTSFKKH